MFFQYPLEMDDYDFCAEAPPDAQDRQSPDRDWRCDKFTPSLLCRNTRASERTAAALERLADRFAPEATLSMTELAVRAVEAWLDYNAGRSSSAPFSACIDAYGRAKEKDSE
jgi:hypothetical protein